MCSCTYFTIQVQHCSFQRKAPDRTLLVVQNRLEGTQLTFHKLVASTYDSESAKGNDGFNNIVRGVMTTIDGWMEPDKA